MIHEIWVGMMIALFSLNELAFDPQIEVNFWSFVRSYVGRVARVGGIGSARTACQNMF